MTATIGICLATYNGARFLPAQLESITAQTHHDWHLHVRDDASDDGTPDILAEFAFRYPRQVTLIRDRIGRLGAQRNFAQVMSVVREPYIAFSDQDDTWRPTKLARTLARLRALEAARAPGTPAMVHADRRVVDADGAEITPSYWQSRRLAPRDFRRLETHYAFCFAAGSTMLINRPLCDLALPIPEAARMYDCWIELVAHAFGRVAALDEIALDHRRHGANASGSAGDIDSASARRLLARAVRLLRHLDRYRATCLGYFCQAAAFRARHGIRLSAEAATRLDQFLSVPDRSLPGRVWALLHSGALPPGLLRRIALAVLADARARPTPATHGATLSGMPQSFGR